MQTYYAYVYRDPSRNMEPFYVGKGTKVRALGHHRRRDKHPLVQRLQKMQRDGIAPTIELIVAIDEEHAYFMERCLTDVIGRKDLGKGPLLNLCDGGRGPTGKRMSPEARLKISLSQIGKKLTKEHKLKIGASLLGKIQNPKKGQKISASKRGVANSAEHNAKLSAALKGKPWTAERKAANPAKDRPWTEARRNAQKISP